MAGPNRIDSTPVRMSTSVTVARQTAKTDFGDKVSAGLGSAANAVAQGAALAAPLLPGGSIVSAAVSSFSQMGSGIGGAGGQYMGGSASVLGGSSGIGNFGGTAGGMPTTNGQTASQAVSGGGEYSNQIAQSMDENKQLLNMQIAMQRENQVFSTVSNVLKVRHDTVKNSIQNVR